MTLDSATPSSDVEREALAKGLLGADAARRVGWAKAFDALRRCDGLEEEVRQLTDELRSLRRAYSRLCGVYQHCGVPGSPILNEELGRHYEAERKFRHEDAWRAGRAVAEAHLAHRKQREKGFYNAARARHKAERYRMFGALEALAGPAGHTVTLGVRPDDGDCFVALCRCGDHTEGTERHAQSWRFEHLAREVLGCSLDDYKAQWRAAHQPEDTIEAAS